MAKATSAGAIHRSSHSASIQLIVTDRPPRSMMLHPDAATPSRGRAESHRMPDRHPPLRLGHQTVGDLPPLTASDPQTAPAILHRRLADDGYLYLPGFLPATTVADGRRRILEALRHSGAIADDASDDSLCRSAGRAPGMMGVDGLAAEAAIRQVLEHPRLFGFFEDLFGEPARTYPFKWLRAVGGGAFTGAHMDRVYMGRGSQRLHTVWIPFADLAPHDGVLAVCPGSQRNPALTRVRETYGRLDVDQDAVDGWLTTDLVSLAERYDLRWHASPVAAGDVIIFGLHFLHASTTNDGLDWRLSCDVRFQPASDPVDPRWDGPAPTGHTHPAGTPRKDMAALRQEWDI